MKKVMGVLCGLTILSAYAGNSALAEISNSSRRAPMLNEGGTGGSYAASPMAGGSSMPNSGMPDFAQPDPSYNTGSYGSSVPPLPGQQYSGTTTTTTTTSSTTYTSPAQPSALPSGRRVPEFNRQALGQSGDLLAPSPTAPVTSMNTMPQMPVPPVPPAPGMAPAALPQAAMVPPPPPVAPMASSKDEYPRLAQIPASPAAPRSVNDDARVQQLRSDLAGMENPPAQPKVIVKSVSKGGYSVPEVQTQARNAPPSSVAPVPGVTPPGPAPEPIFASNSSVPIPPKPIAPPMPPQAPAMAQAPSTQFSQPSQGLMPKGPTVVVSSKGAPRVTESAAFAQPIAPVPPAPVASAPIPPAPMAPAPRQVASMPTPPAPPAYMPPAPAMAPMAVPPAPGYTNPSQLRPISPASDPVNSQSFASADMGGAYTSTSSLRPINSVGSNRLLPDSRYAKLRAAARNNYNN